MNKFLTDMQIAHFHEMGYIKNIPVLDQSALVVARNDFEYFTQQLTLQDLTHNDVNGWWAVNRSFYNLCRTPVVLDCFEDLLGPDLLIWGGQYFHKAPGDGNTVQWHQDAFYWPLTPREHCVSAWIALYDTDAGNGCMRVIPGTHRKVLDHLGSKKETDVLANTLADNQLNLDDAVDIDLRAGEMSLHTDAVVHGSEANRSTDRPRCGVTMRISSPDVQNDSTKNPNFHWLQLRGRDPYENNPKLDPPTQNDVPTGYNQFGKR